MARNYPEHERSRGHIPAAKTAYEIVKRHFRDIL